MLIKFICNNISCGNNITKLFKKASDIPSWLDCGSCGTGKLERILGAPASRSTQIVDNGLMAKQVELDSEMIVRQQEKLERQESD
jgi:hypothetical protein